MTLNNFFIAPTQPNTQSYQPYDRPENNRAERKPQGVENKIEEESSQDESSRARPTFLEFIMAQSSGQQGQVLGVESFVPDEGAELGFVSLVAATPENKEGVQNFIETTQLGDDVALSQTLALNQIALDNIRKPVSGEGDALSIEGGEIPEDLSTLLSLNLTPAQLAALQEAQKSGKGEEVLDAIFAGSVAIIPPQDNIVQIASATVRQTGIKTPDMQQNMREESARLNGLNVGLEDSGLKEQTVKYLDGNFKAALKDALNNGAGKGTHQTDNVLPGHGNHANGAVDSAARGTTHNGSALQGWPFSMDGSLLSSLDGVQAFNEELGQHTPYSTNATQMGNLTSLISQSQGAGHTHPASQMVAVSIQKAVGKGENTNLTIQLDPPELGRVEVRMSFTKDKSLKTTIIAEKPETYMMLQRDAQMLDRMIQEMGLESDGGVNFELAEQGFDFDQDNQRGGGHDKGGTGAGGAEDSETEIIETTMTWLVDPETGHMRYNIMA